MKQPRFNPFRRLQWRLTFSYTLVTVGALLFVELILLGALLLLLNSDFLVTRLVTTIRDDITPQLSAYLEESPPDLAGLNDWLEPAASRQAGQGQASPRLTRGLSINLEPDEGDIYILDAQGYLLAQLVSPGHEARLGHAFDIPAYPELGRLLPLALPLLNSQSLAAILSLVLYSAIPLTLIAAAIGTIFGFLTARGLSRQLNQMAEQLQHLLQTQQELAALQERNRLARDLHDSVKQQVFATTMQISAAKALLPADTAAAAQHLHEAEQLSHQSQQELATLIEALRPGFSDRQRSAPRLWHPDDAPTHGRS